MFFVALKYHRKKGLMLKSYQEHWKKCNFLKEREKTVKEEKLNERWRRKWSEK
jgi:hypothetical protein